MKAKKNAETTNDYCEYLRFMELGVVGLHFMIEEGRY